MRWVAWKKSEIREPYIILMLTEPIIVTGIRIVTFVNNSVNASTIKKFVVSSEKVLAPYVYRGETCSPDSAHEATAQKFDFVIKFGNLTLQYLKVSFDYTGEWILVRKVQILTGNIF